VDQAGQRKIVFSAFDAVDECPVHVGAHGKRLLRPGQLAILVCHASQVWEKKTSL
jgi:hypothetical protein